MFTNRKLPANKHSELQSYIKKKVGIKNVEIIGIEDIGGYLDDFSDLAIDLELYKFLYPLTFREKQIRDVVILFEQKRHEITKNAVGGILDDFSSISKEEKNKLKDLGNTYCEFRQSHSLKFFEEIERFLKDPKNKQFARYYENTVSDLQAKIILERSQFKAFEFLIEHLINYGVDNNKTELEDIRNMVRVFFHFMYFNCDIGRKV